MAVSSRIVERIYTEIVLNVAKKDSTVDMTNEVSALWDEIAAEVAQMKADGKDFEIPSEMPDPVQLTPVEQERSVSPSGRLDALAKLSRLYLDK